MQDYAEAVQAAQAAHVDEQIADLVAKIVAASAPLDPPPRCCLCGRVAESYIWVGGGLIVGCPCVELWPGGPAMIAVSLDSWTVLKGLTMEPKKLTMQDLANAAHEGFVSAPTTEQRWPNAVRLVLQAINDHLPITLAMHTDGEVTVDVSPTEKNMAPIDG
jgi:hypothetical protein